MDLRTIVPQFPTPAATLALHSLATEALKDEARALAWHLFTEHGMDYGKATIEAVTTLGELAAFSAEWDATEASHATA